MSITASDDPASTKTDAFIEKCRLAPYQNGVLTGLTFAVKDVIDVAGKHTGCGNPTWRETHPPAVANAICVEQILSEGGTCLGKTITDELALDMIGENHFYGTPINTKAPDRVPGGSSSGSASAVAGGYVDFALGTDTGGSIRIPASNCGLYGFRPSHGIIPVAGVASLAPSFDTIGVIAETADVLARASGVLLSQAVPSAPYVKRLFVLKEAFEVLSDEVRRALEKPLQTVQSALGLKVEELSARRIDRRPTDGWLEDWLSTYRIIHACEVWNTFGPWIEAHAPKFGPRIAKNFEYARNADRAQLAAALKFRETLFRRCMELLEEGDLLCMPTVADVAPRKGSVGSDRYRNTYVMNTMSLTSVSGICRLPQATMPVAQIDGAPIGLSLLARHGSDGIVLSAVLQVSKQNRA